MVEMRVLWWCRAWGVMRRREVRRWSSEEFSCPKQNALRVSSQLNDGKYFNLFSMFEHTGNEEGHGLFVYRPCLPNSGLQIGVDGLEIYPRSDDWTF